jgi:mannose-6-phosphate isomerase-like protein (cupin superfamily)
MDDFGQLNIKSYQPPHLYGVHHVNLYRHEETTADLVVLPPGALISPHRHENAHELFDVIGGQGTFIVDGRPVSGEVGKCVFIPAGIQHSMRNNGDGPWTVRVTYQQRIYPRHLGKLVGRAIRKRLGLFYS